ncbi:hypothetical protein CLOL250_02706 [Clostridium sp. L2-50]|uniref:DUF4143 domain-containing protein n=2 Tax=Bacillota TaxID=1239 RepID=UPI00015BD8A1|nr:hypothetical protein CLOL250_02706 [Clostridium sp. L2-50]
MRYKLFMLDVGLLGALSELPATSILEENDIFMEFKGNLTEQYMLQQMISDTPYTLYVEQYRLQRLTWELNYIRILDLYIMVTLCNINFNGYSISD